jgi:hypothetical protein
MTRFTLQMGSDNCGGLTEYVNFFTALRKIYRIKQQRKELREEIQDVLSLVEQSYIEEERKLKLLHDLTLENEKRVIHFEKERQLEIQKSYENILAMVAAVAIPPTLIFRYFCTSFLSD